MLQVPPDWSVGPIGLNSNRDRRGRLFLSLSARGQDTAPAAGVSHAALRFPSLPTFPLADQLEFGHYSMFNYKIYGPEYSELVGSGGMASGDPSSRPLSWQSPDFHEGIPQTDAQQPALSAYPVFERPAN